MHLVNETSGAVIAREVRDARTPISRLIGLLSSATVSPEQGIWLAHCPAIHTIGMRATIDIIFLDGANRVLAKTPGAVPHRFLYTAHGAKAVVELGAGSRLEFVRTGDTLALVDSREA